MKTMVRIKIGDEMEFDADYSTGTDATSIDEAITFLTLAKNNGANTIEWRAITDCDGLSELVTAQPINIREETDEEYEKRIKEENLTRENALLYHKNTRRQQYEELKKEFEGK